MGTRRLGSGLGKQRLAGWRAGGLCQGSPAEGVLLNPSHRRGLVARHRIYSLD